MDYIKWYFWNILIGVDQGVGTLFGITADLTISGYVGYMYPGSWKESAINWVFGSDTHCIDSIEWDIIKREIEKGTLPDKLNK